MWRMRHPVGKIDEVRQRHEEVLVMRLLGVLALTALAMHLLDLTSFMVMVNKYGIGVEQNPFMRTLYTSVGLTGLAIVKVGGVLMGLILLLWLGRNQRVYLAYISLFIAAWIGWLGFASNQV